MKALREPLWWLIALFIGLLAGLFPQRAAVQSVVPGAAATGLPAGELLGAHLDHGWLVVASSLAATAIGLGLGWRSTARRRRVSSAGGDHRRYRQTFAGGGAGDGGAGAGLWLAAGADSPRAVWHTAGAAGDAGRAGFDTAGVSGVAEGMGMTGWQRLYKVELPLAAPVILAGDPHLGHRQYWYRDHCLDGGGPVRLGTPIIIGLSGFNTAYIVQGRCWWPWRRLSSTARLSV